MRRYTWLLVALGLFVALLAAPLVVEERYSHMALKSGAVLAASNNIFSLSSPVRLMSGPTVDLESGTLSVPRSRSGLARSGQVIAMLITGAGPQMTLENAEITIDFSTPEPTVSQGRDEGEVAPLVEAMQRMQFDALDIKDATVRIRMADGSSIKLKNVNVALSARASGAIGAVGSFEYRNEKIEFDTKLGAATDQHGMARPITAALRGALLTASLEGSLLLGSNPRLLAPQAQIATEDLRAVARWLGIDLPEGHGLRQFRAQGELEWVDRTIAFQEAALTLDNNAAGGAMSVSFAGARPALEATIGAKELDLSLYLEGMDIVPGPGGFLAALRDAEVVSVPLINAIDADVRLSADSVSLPGISFARSAATLSLRSGKLLADIAELEIDEGTRGSGQVRIDTGGAVPAYGVQAKLESTDVGRPLMAIYGHPTVQGPGSLTIDLITVGNKGERLIGALEGKLCVLLDEGGRIGIDVNRLAAADQNPLADDAWKGVSTGAISVDRLDVRFIVKDGVLSTQTAEAVSGSRAVKASGSVSLPDSRLDLQLAVGDVGATDGNPGTPLKLEREHTVKLEGPWSAPQVGPAGTQPARDLSQNPG